MYTNCTEKGNSICNSKSIINKQNKLKDGNVTFASADVIQRRNSR